MRYALMIEPQQGLSYEEILAVARTAEEAGLEAIFRSDHYASFPGPAGLATTDAWATLAGLARDTSTIRIGSLVTPVTFRIPGSFAKQAVTVDEMSGGRLEVGLGAGWNKAEHEQLGIPYPDTAGRFEMLEEALTVIHGLWTEADGWGYEGRHWQVRNARFAPKPVRGDRRHPPIILGGQGKPRLAGLVARFADEFNIDSATPAAAAAAYERIRVACESISRDPDDVTRSAMTGVMIAETLGELGDRVAQQVEMVGAGRDTDEWLADREGRWIMGTPDKALERVAALEAAGVQRIMLQDFLPRDLDMVRLMGRIFTSG